MHLIIHCGRSKTGTSALQGSLRKNHRMLLKHGVFYYTGGLSNHNPLALLAGKNPRMTQKQKEAQIEQAKVLVSQITESVRAEDTPYLLLSAEYMEDFTKEQFRQLLDIFRIEFSSATAIMYIRSPHAMYLSRMQQKVKADHLLLAPRKYRDDTLSCIDGWTRTVGAENLIVRAYMREKMQGGDVVKDFRLLLNEAFHLNIPELSSVRANESLSAESAVTLQKYRKICCADQSRVFLETSNYLINTLFEIERKSSLAFSRPRLKQAVIREIYKNNADAVKAIDERYPELEFSRHCLESLENAGERDAEDEKALRALDFEDILADLVPETLAVLPYLAMDKAIHDYLDLRGKFFLQKIPLSKLKEKIYSLRSQMAAIRAEYQETVNSRSWRATAPFRRMARFFQRLRPKPGGNGNG